LKISVTLALVILNVLAYFLEMQNQDLAVTLFGLWPVTAAPEIPPFHIWQVLTYSVLHGNPEHIFFNMFGLYTFGLGVERALGRIKVLELYLVAVIGGALVQLAVDALTLKGFPTIGASAGVFGLLVSYTILFPKRRIVLLFPPIPMPAWVFASGYTLLELFLGITGVQAGVAHFAHLGGVFGSVLLLLYWIAKARRSRSSVNQP
jgi:membrane associated rhomboid family serine protease